MTESVIAAKAVVIMLRNAATIGKVAGTLIPVAALAAGVLPLVSLAQYLEERRSPKV